MKDPFPRLISTIKDFVYVKQLPKAAQWRQILKVLSQKEKIILVGLIFSFIGSAAFLLINGYLKHTQFQPAKGGEFVEGLVGQPRWLNPIYAPANDVDRDLTELLFSGLLKYDGNGELVKDLAKDYQIKEQGKVYEFYLRENLVWHDNTPLTIDDVIFTMEIVQNSDYKSPLRANWLGVEIEKITQEQQEGVRFKLKKSYAPFLETTTLKLLPKHIWQDIPAERFSLSPYNLQPIGSGPYKFEQIEQDKLGYIKSVTLKRNKKYFAKKPFINKIKFLFFENEQELVQAAKQGIIDALSSSLVKEVNLKNGFNAHILSMPRYFAIFFNPEKSPLLAQSKIRQALNHGVDKNALIQEVFGPRENQEPVATALHSPILPHLYGYSPASKIYQYNPEKANQLLDQTGFKDKNEHGFREKIIKKESSSAFKSDLEYRSQGKEVKELQKCLAQDPTIYPEGEITGFFGPATKRAVIRFQEKHHKDILEPWGFEKGTGMVGKTTRNKLNEVCNKSKVETVPLRILLVTASDPLLEKTALALKEQLQKLGIDLEIQIVGLAQLEKDFIKKRDYQALLFGEVLGSIPDLFPFWHSSQKKDPGLNLSLFQSSSCDKLLQEARESLNVEERAEKYEKFQDLVIEAAPAVFLYNPDYIYFAFKKLKGINTTMLIDPSKRFSTISDWYIKTKRKWK